MRFPARPPPPSGGSARTSEVRVSPAPGPAGGGCSRARGLSSRWRLLGGASPRERGGGGSRRPGSGAGEARRGGTAAPMGFVCSWGPRLGERGFSRRESGGGWWTQPRAQPCPPPAPGGRGEAGGGSRAEGRGGCGGLRAGVRRDAPSERGACAPGPAAPLGPKWDPRALQPLASR